MMPADPRDAALLGACPCVAVPRYGALPPLERGERVLVARDGLYVEVRLAWLDCRLRIAALPTVPPLPYGEAREHIRFAFGVIPMGLLREFFAFGRACLPDEAAGALVYSEDSGLLRLVLHDPIEAGPAGIRYAMAAIAADETIAVDLHTHGLLSAGWSATDDADDQGIKVCGVFGSLDQAIPTVAFRIAVNGMFRPLRSPWGEQAP